MKNVFVTGAAGFIGSNLVMELLREVNQIHIIGIDNMNDVPVTYADTTALEEDFGFKPQTSLRTGLRKFAQWYKEFYK